MVRYKPTDPRHPDHPENYRQKFRTRKNMAGSTASVSGEYGFFCGFVRETAGFSRKLFVGRNVSSSVFCFRLFTSFLAIPIHKHHFPFLLRVSIRTNFVVLETQKQKS